MNNRKDFRLNREQRRALQNNSDVEFDEMDGSDAVTKKNKIAMGLSISAVALIVALGAFVAFGTEKKGAIKDDVIEGMDNEEVQAAVQEAFLQGVEEYLNGDITKDEIKTRIMQLLADYLNSSSYFTDNQKTELRDFIAKYLEEIQVEDLIAKNDAHITTVQNELKKYIKQNNQTLEMTKNMLQTEITNNHNYTQEQVKILNELHQNLEKLELKHFNNITKYFNETIERFDHIDKENQTKMHDGIEMWKPYKVAESTGEVSGKYEINTSVMYVIKTERHDTGTDSDLKFSGGNEFDGYRSTDVRMYKNLTGINTDKAPNVDKDNWEEVSLAEAIQNIVNVTLDGTTAFNEWVETHKTDADGTVIDQCVTYNNYIYQNISGEFDPEKTPDQDEKNWQRLSVMESVTKNFQTMLDDMYGNIKSFTEWMKEHETNAGGDVIDQIVTYKNKIYINITGEYDSEKTPEEDTTNWKEMSLTEVVNNVYNTYLEGIQGDTLGWDAEKQYTIDEYVIYKNKIYRNITGESTSTNPAEDTVNWREASVFGEITNNYQTFLERLYGDTADWSAAASYKPNSYVMYKHQLYRNITGVNTDVTPDKDTVNWEPSSMITVIQNTYNTFLAATGAKDYVASESHSAGEYVVYNNVVYKNVSDNAGAMGGQPIPGVKDGDGTQSVWVAVSITDMIDKNYQTFVATVGAEDYNNEHNYQAGDYVIKNGTLYRATDVTTGSFDSSKWEKVTVTDQIEGLRTELDSLALQYSTNLDMVNKNLTDIINENKSLSDEQREQMLAIIDGNKDSSLEGLSKLQNDLLAVIDSNENANTTERAKLLEQMQALSDNTASYMDDYEKRIKDLENRTTSLDGSQKFQFDYQNGIYGYSVDGTFRPY